MLTGECLADNDRTLTLTMMVDVAARNDARPDAHSSPVSDARWLRL
jgi:hypothetical protein